MALQKKLRPHSSWIAAIFALLALLVALVVVWNLLGVAWFITASASTPTLTSDLVLADFDADGDLDVYLAMHERELTAPDRLWLNQGGKQGGATGAFRDSGQRLGDHHSRSATPGDINGDGHHDVMVGGWGVHYYTGDGAGQLSGPRHLARLLPDGAEISPALALGDLNGDGRVDAFLGGCCGAFETPGGLFAPVTALPLNSAIWLNNNSGGAAGQRLPLPPVMSAVLGDLDGDSDLDAFIATGDRHDGQGQTARQPNLVWLNDGAGVFHDSGQQLGAAPAHAVVLGDIDGDGSLDAVVGDREFAEVWLNDGRGRFSATGQRLRGGPTRWLFLEDLDGDGDLDLFLGNPTTARLWLNDGSGQFQPHRRRIRYESHQALALGDVTGDGRVDIFIAGVDGYQVWQRQGDGSFSAGPVTVME